MLRRKLLPEPEMRVPPGRVRATSCGVEFSWGAWLYEASAANIKRSLVRE